MSQWGEQSPALAFTIDAVSQDELAVKMQLAGLQIGQMAISRIETGKRLVPDFELPILAEALGVTTNWLLGQDE